jgi:hypothetical protein
MEEDSAVLQDLALAVVLALEEALLEEVLAVQALVWVALILSTSLEVSLPKV